MISEIAMGLIQRVGQTLFSAAHEMMRERDWSSVVLKAEYDNVGGYTRNCRVLSEPDSEELISLTITDEVDGPLLSLDEHRFDANGKEWRGLTVTISHQGEVNIQLGYETNPG